MSDEDYSGCGIVEQARALARHIFLANDKTGLQAPQEGTGGAVSKGEDFETKLLAIVR